MILSIIDGVPIPGILKDNNEIISDNPAAA
jgi:hypothetical protein